MTEALIVTPDSWLTELATSLKKLPLEAWSAQLEKGNQFGFHTALTFISLINGLDQPGSATDTIYATLMTMALVVFEQQIGPLLASQADAQNNSTPLTEIASLLSAEEWGEEVARFTRPVAGVEIKLQRKEQMPGKVLNHYLLKLSIFPEYGQLG